HYAFTYYNVRDIIQFYYINLLIQYLWKSIQFMLLSSLFCINLKEENYIDRLTHMRVHG
ncbi:hypothetical protein L9F63_001193, partial [Diploptera punctata]